MIIRLLIRMVIIMIMSSIGLFNDDFHDYLDEFGDDGDEIEYHSCFCKLSQKRLLRRNNWKLQSIPSGADTTVGQILLSRDFLDRNLRRCIRLHLLLMVIMMNRTRMVMMMMMMARTRMVMNLRLCKQLHWLGKQLGAWRHSSKSPEHIIRIIIMILNNIINIIITIINNIILITIIIIIIMNEMFTAAGSMR